MPSIAAGAELSVLMDPDGLPALQVSGAVWPGHRSNGARYTLAYGGVALCPFVGDTVVGRLGACAGMAVGAMAGSVGAPADLYYVAAHPFVDLRGAWRLVGPLIATGGLSVAIPLYRPTFNYSSGHRMAPVAGIAMMGIGMEVP